MTQTLNVVQGEIEAVSGEGELQAGPNQCWVKLKGGETYLANVLQAINLKPGEPVKFTYEQRRGGLHITQILDSKPVEVSGYDGLLNRCRELIVEVRHTGLEYIKAGWKLGKELLELPRKYGDKTVPKLAADLDVSVDYLYRCIRLAETYPEISANFGTVQKSLTWRELTRPGEKKPETELSTLPTNALATPAELVESYNTEAKRPPKSESKPELQMRSILDDLGIKHLSQESIMTETKRGPQVYIADFVINRRLILEVDSKLHKPERDQERDKALRKAGYEVLRFQDKEIESAYTLLSRLTQAIATLKEAT